MKQGLCFLAAIVLLLATGTSQAGGSGSRYALSEDELAVVQAFTPFLDARLQESELSKLDQELASRRQAAGALAAAILYRHQPGKYQSAMFDRYAVRDYSLREQGIYNIVAPNEVFSSVRDLEARYPTLRDRRVLLLLTFLHYQDSNEWFSVNGQKVSAARFFRTAFLAGALQRTGIDPVELANAIDHAAQMNR